MDILESFKERKAGKECTNKFKVSTLNPKDFMIQV